MAFVLPIRTRFIERQQELDALQQALAQAGAGHGQMVAVVGEAGVGKSRLLYEFVHTHQAHGWLVLESASVPYGKATPYFPVIDLLKRYSHIEEPDDARTRRANELGMRPLIAHCHLGLGTLYAKLGRPVQVRPELTCCHHAVPRHGDDLLAAPGGGLMMDFYEMLDQVSVFEAEALCKARA